MMSLPSCHSTSPDFSLAGRSRLLLKSDFRKILHELSKPAGRGQHQASVSQTLRMFSAASGASAQVFRVSGLGFHSVQF